MEREGLNPQQERFVLEMVKDLNGTQAAIRAGYSPASARQQASELLTNPAVKAALAEEKARYAQLVHIEAYRIIRELALVAHSDVTKFDIDERTGKVTAGPELPPEATLAISSVERKPKMLPGGKVGYDVKIRLWPKVEALKLLGQYVGMFEKGSSPDALPGVLVIQGVDQSLVLGLKRPEAKPDAPGSDAAGEGGPRAV